MRKLRIDYNKYINKHYGICIVLEFIGYKQVGKRNRAFFKVVCKCGRKWEARADSLWRLQSCGNCLNWQEGLAAFSELYGTYKKRSLEKFGKFELNKDQFRKITKQLCYYCEASPSNIAKKKWHNGAYIYNGIDRFDNNIGYTLENSIPCCKTCNYAKRNLTFDEFNNWIKRIKNIDKNMISNRKFKFVPTQSLFFDVDDTIIFWPKHPNTFENDKDAIIFNYNNHNFYLKPNFKMIEEIKQKFKDGYEIIIWSYGSKEWAHEVIEKLNLTGYIDYITSKPDYYYDDLDVKVFLKKKRRYIK